MSCLWRSYSSASFPGLHFWGSAFHWFYLHIYIHAPSQASNSSSRSTPSCICRTCLDHFHLALFLGLPLTPSSPWALPNVFLWTCFLTPQLQTSLKWVFRFLGDYLISLKRKCSFLGSETATGTVFCAAAVALACFGFRHLWFAVTPTQSQMEACTGAARSGRHRCAPVHVSLQPEWRDDVAEVGRAAL